MVLILWKVDYLWDIDWKTVGKLWKTKDWTPDDSPDGWEYGTSIDVCCTDRRFNIWIVTKEVKLDRRPGEDMNFGFMLWCWIITLPLLIMSSLSGRFALKIDHEIGKYRYAPHNDVSVKDRPHIRRWSHNIIIYSKTCLKQTPYIPETWTNGK
jgi:hypothetical protein